MEKKIVKDPKRLFSILSKLNLSATRAFAFLLFTEKPHQYFKITYAKINQLAHVSNSYLCMNELLEKGLIEKRGEKKETEWMITVDLVE